MKLLIGEPIPILVEGIMLNVGARLTVGPMPSVVGKVTLAGAVADTGRASAEGAKLMVGAAPFVVVAVGVVRIVGVGIDNVDVLGAVRVVGEETANVVTLVVLSDTPETEPVAVADNVAASVVDSDSGTLDIGGDSPVCCAAIVLDVPARGCKAICATMPSTISGSEVTVLLGNVVNASLRASSGKLGRKNFFCALQETTSRHSAKTNGNLPLCILTFIAI